MYNSDTQSVNGGLLYWPRRVESWMDDRGRGAWITAMVLGFIFVWPVGLALLAYMIWSKRMSKSFGRKRSLCMSDWGKISGNSAFDAYRADTIRRLEEEQDAFEAFLKRLRDAKDKQEFDSFMEDRAKAKSPDTAKDIKAY
jgi:hypothetical protein